MLTFRARVPALAVLLAFLCPGGLVTTLQPIYDAGSLEVDDTLRGSWQSQDLGATVVVERGEWKSYRLTYTARSTSYAFVGYLTKIGDWLFLDLTPAQALEAGPLVIPAHGICRLRHEGDALSVAVLDYDHFMSAVRARKLSGLEAALDARQNLLVTSKTDALRAWLQKNAGSVEVFREPTSFARAK